MKFLNFFKTTLGITILVIAVIAILLIIFNWDTIKSWWSSDNATPGQTRTQAPGNGSASKKICVSLGGGNCSYQGLSVPCSECTKRGITII